jgi:hypothetical protein
MELSTLTPRMPLIALDGVIRHGIAVSFNGHADGPRRLDGTPVRRLAWLAQPFDGGPPMAGARLHEHALTITPSMVG